MSRGDDNYLLQCALYLAYSWIINDNKNGTPSYQSICSWTKLSADPQWICHIIDLHDWGQQFYWELWKLIWLVVQTVKVNCWLAHQFHPQCCQFVVAHKLLVWVWCWELLRFLRGLGWYEWICCLLRNIIWNIWWGVHELFVASGILFLGY